MLELDSRFIEQFHSELGNDEWSKGALDQGAGEAGLVALFGCEYAVVGLAFCKTPSELESRWQTLHGAVADARSCDDRRNVRDYYLVIVVPSIPADSFGTVAAIVNDRRVCRKIVLSADAEDVKALLRLCPFGDLNADYTDGDEGVDAAVASQAAIEPTEETISELARLGDEKAFEWMKSSLDKFGSGERES